MATMSKKLRRLEEMYSRLPVILCKGLCADQCSVVPIYEIERHRMEQAAKRSLPILSEGPISSTLIMAPSEGNRCPLLVNQRCSIYQDRPLICRLFGVADGLACPHGCTQLGQLSREDVYTLQSELSKL